VKFFPVGFYLVSKIIRDNIFFDVIFTEIPKFTDVFLAGISWEARFADVRTDSFATPALGSCSGRGPGRSFALTIQHGNETRRAYSQLAMQP
jgi:hypothetical protein